MARTRIPLRELRSFKRICIPDVQQRNHDYHGYDHVLLSMAPPAARSHITWSDFKKRAAKIFAKRRRRLSAAAAGSSEVSGVEAGSSPIFPVVALELLFQKLDSDGKKQMEAYLSGCADFSNNVLKQLASTASQVTALERARMASAKKLQMDGQEQQGDRFEVEARLAEVESELKSVNATINELRASIDDKDGELCELNARVRFNAAADAKLFELRRVKEEQTRVMDSKDHELHVMKIALARMDYELKAKDEEFTQNRLMIKKQDDELKRKRRIEELQDEVEVGQRKIQELEDYEENRHKFLSLMERLDKLPLP